MLYEKLQTMYITLNNLKIDSRNRIFCTIEGVISENFTEKEVNARQVFKSKLYITNSQTQKNLINTIYTIDKSTKNVFASPSILLNFWHPEIFKPYKDLLKKGTKIKAQGMITFKVYKRDYGEKRLHLFFAVNKLLDVKSPALTN